MIILKTARLLNFIGNYKGTKTREVSLKFNSKGIINFQGSNGSGKTSTLRLLHPYSDSKDELIVDEEASTEDKVVYLQAEKELLYDVDGKEVKILILYSKTGTKKCYISVDGEELNPNGNATSFNQIVETTFGFPDDLISNRIVTTVKSNNFLELSPIQRKTEISSLLPDITKYVKAFKIVDAKKKSIETRIKFLASEMNNLTGLNDLETLLSSYKDNLAKTDELLETHKLLVEQRKAPKLEILSKINIIKQEFKFDPNFDTNSILTNLRSLLSSKLLLLDNFSAVPLNPDYVEDTQKLIEELRLTESNLEQGKNDRLSTLRKLYDNINSINAFKSRFSVIDKEIEVLNKQLQDENKYKQSLFTETDNVDVSLILSPVKVREFNNALHTINQIKTSGLSNEILNNFSNEVKNVRITEQNIISLRASINELIGLKQGYYNLLNMAKDFSTKLSGIVTEDCNLEGCTETIMEKISSVDAEIELKQKTLNEIVDIDNSVLLSLIPFFSSLYDFTNQINYGYEGDFKWDIIQLMKQSIESSLTISNEESSKQERQAHNNKIISDSNNKIEAIEFNLQNKMSQKNEMLTNNTMTQDISQLDNIVSENSAQCSSLDKEISEIDSKLSKVRNDIKKLQSDLSEYLNRPNINIIHRDINNLEKYIKFIEESIEKINIENVKINESVNQYNIYFNNKVEIQKQITETETIINLVNRYSIEYEQLNSKLTSYIKILEALHISKGLPSIISSKILSVIQDDCNEIIEKMFRKQFAINFVNTEKELSLLVYNSYNGKVTEYNNLSGGEQSIIKMVLSLSLLKFKVGENGSTILRLDEIDAFLDGSNRQSFDLFLDLLMSEKGVNQLFLISHNISLEGQKVFFDKSERRINVTGFKNI